MTARHLSLVIPAYQEEKGITHNLREIHAQARATTLPFTLIVVDDGSLDDTWVALQSLAGEMPELHAIRLSRNFGKEGAIAAGLDAATGDATIILDADLQHPPSLIPEMVRRWQDEGWDVVEAVKAHRGRESWLQRLTARSFYRTASALTGYNLQDASDFKLLDRRVVDAWHRFGERATFFRGLVAWLGFRRTQVFFEVPPRAEGGSRWSLASLTGLAVHAVTAFSAIPLQVVTVLGVLTLLIGTLVGLQAVRLWYQGLALPGFTTVILLQLMIGGFLMISMGIIGTYIARIYDEVKARPRYLVREVIKGE
ncbi:MAG TPA: glycosyltransferase family 2 protein [Vicinamibacterales bacterium]|nr:glycosyltransferase family 2 protein [Vicinamibacterales bacterium]